MSLQTDLQLERLRKALRVRDHWRLQAEPTVVPVIDVREHLRSELAVPPTIFVVFEHTDLNGAGSLTSSYTVPAGRESEMLGYNLNVRRTETPTTDALVQLETSIELPTGQTFNILFEQISMPLGDRVARGDYVTRTMDVARFPAGTTFRTGVLFAGVGGVLSVRRQVFVKEWLL